MWEESQGLRAKGRLPELQKLWCFCDTNCHVFRTFLVVQPMSQRAVMWPYRSWHSRNGTRHQEKTQSLGHRLEVCGCGRGLKGWGEMAWCSSRMLRSLAHAAPPLGVRSALEISSTALIYLAATISQSVLSPRMYSSEQNRVGPSPHGFAVCCKEADIKPITQRSSCRRSSERKSPLKCIPGGASAGPGAQVRPPCESYLYRDLKDWARVGQVKVGGRWGGLFRQQK